MEVTYDEIMEILDLKISSIGKERFNPTTWTVWNSQFLRKLEYSLPDIVKVSNTIDVFRLRSN